MMILRMLADSIMASGMPKDTLRVMDVSQVAAFYADLLDQQQAQFNIFLIAIGIIFAAALGVTWWWNYKGSKAQISEEVQTGIKRFQRLLNTHKISTEKQINEVVNRRVNERMESLSKSLNKELDSFKGKIEEDNQKMNADLCRVFALHCSKEESFFNSAKWWISAFEGYVAISDGRFQQISVNAYVKALKSFVKTGETLSDSQIESLEDIKEKTSNIPDVFAKQRSEANQLLRELEEKNK